MAQYLTPEGKIIDMITGQQRMTETASNDKPPMFQINRVMST